MSYKPAATTNESLMRLINEAHATITSQKIKIDASRQECEKFKQLAIQAEEKIAKLKQQNEKLEQQNVKQKAITAEVEEENTRLLAIDKALLELLNIEKAKNANK